MNFRISFHGWLRRALSASEQHKWLLGSLTYGASALVPFTGVVAVYGLGAFASIGVWDTWGDVLYFQALAQVATDSGIFGLSNHLAWPDTHSGWSPPQSGLSITVPFWFFGRIVGFSSSAVVVWTLAAIASFNGVAITYFLRSLSVSRRLAPLTLSIAVAISLSPFVLLKIGHLNVAAFFAIPFALGAAFRFRKSTGWGTNTRIAVVPFLALLVAPLWWLVVCILLAAVILFISCLARSWQVFKRTGVIASWVLLCISLQAVISRTAPGSSAVTRGRWDSNTYGGHMVDAVIASPFLNSLFSRLEIVRPGTSAELSLVGAIPAAFAAIAVATFMVALMRNGFADKRIARLSLLASVSTLFFLAGGFGNLQAGLFALLDSGSPARVWSRMLIVISILGCGVVIVALEQFANSDGIRLSSRIRRLTLVVLPLLIVVLPVLDALAMKSNVLSVIPEQKLSEGAAVRYLEEAAGPDCPILQLPIDSALLPMVKDPKFFPESYYRGYIPFILAPSLKWSFGDYQRKERNPYIDQIGVDIDDLALSNIREAGFCFVLFDKRLAEISSISSSALPGSSNQDLLGSPVFTSDRFDVYRIKAAELR